MSQQDPRHREDDAEREGSISGAITWLLLALVAIACCVAAVAVVLGLYVAVTLMAKLVWG